MKSSAYDRFIESTWDDGWDDWCECVVEAFSTEFYQRNENWIQDNSEGSRSWAWMNAAFNKGLEPSAAAAIIERCHRRYIINKSRP